MRAWASENLQAAWAILQAPDFVDSRADDLREAVQLANTELVTALRQRDEALAELQKAREVIEAVHEAGRMSTQNRARYCADIAADWLAAMRALEER